MFLFLETGYFHLRILFDRDLKEAMEKFSEIDNFRVSKTTVSFPFLIRLRFQGYCCKSGIAKFAGSVTRNYP